MLMRFDKARCLLCGALEACNGAREPTLGWACVHQVRHGARSAARHTHRSAASPDSNSDFDRMDLGVVHGSRHRYCSGALHCWAGRAAPPGRSLARTAQLLVPARRAWVHCHCDDVGSRYLRHGALQRSHGAAHDLDDGGSTVPGAGRTGDPRLADTPPPTARHAASRAALKGGPGVHVRAAYARAVYRNSVRAVLLAVLRDLTPLGVLACVSAFALPDHWLPADVATDGNRSGSWKNQLSAAVAHAVPDAALPCIPWYLDHELDHADRGELVSGVQSDVAPQSAG